MTVFVASAAQEAAQRAIEQAEIIRLSFADLSFFAEALLSPPVPNPALQRAFVRRQKLLKTACAVPAIEKITPDRPQNSATADTSQSPGQA
jgi:hypothetical protein